MVEKPRLTVAGVIWRLLVVCECRLKHPHLLLTRVCHEWGCAPDDDGRKLLLHLVMNMGLDARDMSITENDCLWDQIRDKQTPWFCQNAKTRHTDGDSFWSDVGKGTDPIAFLNRVSGSRRRRCSCAMREHLA